MYACSQPFHGIRSSVKRVRLCVCVCTHARACMHVKYTLPKHTVQPRTRCPSALQPLVCKHTAQRQERTQRRKGGGLGLPLKRPLCMRPCAEHANCPRQPPPPFAYHVLLRNEGADPYHHRHVLRLGGAPAGPRRRRRQGLLKGGPRPHGRSLEARGPAAPALPPGHRHGLPRGQGRRGEGARAADGRGGARGCHGPLRLPHLLRRPAVALGHWEVGGRGEGVERGRLCVAVIVIILQGLGVRRRGAGGAWGGGGRGAVRGGRGQGVAADAGALAPG